MFRVRIASTFRSLSTTNLSATPGTGYLYDSQIPFLHYQESLPRLPIPDLKDTCRRYLASQEPLLDPIDFNRVMKLTKQFENGIGSELHKQLVEKDKTLDPRYSYIHHWWSDMYQKSRGKIILDFNPVLTFKDDPDPSHNSQLNRATNMLVSTIRYFRTLRDGKLPPIKSCAMQFPYLFQSTRIPKPDLDPVIKFPDAKNMIVLRKGNFYSFDVLDSTGQVKDYSAIKSALEEVLADARPRNENALGYLTTLDRDAWTELRVELDATNPLDMKTIDSGLFCICLDDYETVSDTEVCRNGLVGDGGNRWFDKSFSYIISQNGKVGLNWEHSMLDGATFNNLMMEVYNDSIKHDTSSGPDDYVPVSRLDLNLTPNVLAALSTAKESFDGTNKSYDLVAFSYDGFGKSDLKKFGISPDSVSQLLFQMAQWRLHGQCVGTYESCSTAAFRSGRTETIRSCTSTTKECSMLFDHEHPAALSDIVEAMKRNSVNHARICKEAAQGHGWDRHFFGLRNLNSDNGGEALELFSDKSFDNIATIRLSTSTVVSSALQLFLCFGPVSQDGLGLGYLLDKDKFGTAITAYPPHNSATDFAYHLNSACQDVHAVITNKNFKLSRKV